MQEGYEIGLSRIEICGVKCSNSCDESNIVSNDIDPYAIEI